MEIILWIIGITVAVFILGGLKVVNQYQRGVVLTLGRFTGIRQPGLRIVIPIFQKMTRVDVRSTPIDVPKQEVITKDNVTAGVDAVVYFRAVDPAKAVLETTDYVYATSQFAQAALRDITGNFELDELLSKREDISQKIKEIVNFCPGIGKGKTIDLVKIEKKIKNDIKNESLIEKERKI